MTTPERATTVRPMPTARAGSDASLFFIGNATVLIRYAGLTLLTDPNFLHQGDEAPLGYGMTATRLTDPAIELDDLPPVDAVILSHYHGDHFDPIVEERLDRRLPIVTNTQAATTLVDRGFEAVVPLDTWEQHEIRAAGGSGTVRITALPARHAPAVLSIALPDVMGSYLELSSTPGGAATPADRRVYITGDTIVYEALHEIPERYPEIDLALLHLGGTRVMGVTVTMDAEQGVELLRLIGPALAAPIHYDDYDAFASPLEDFLSAAAEAGFGDRVRVIRRGETLAL